jgi:DNA-directed RNA polymerase subunit K/omega
VTRVQISAGPPKGYKVNKIKMEELNKYERSRILGARALQIDLGAPILIKVPEGMSNPLDIALLECTQDALPIAINRN